MERIRKKLIDAFEKRGVKGAFVIKDLSHDEEIISHNMDEVIPSASLIKLFIMIHAFVKINEGVCNLDDEVEVVAEDVVDYSVLKFLSPRKYRLGELIRLMIVYSDNTATNVITDYFGMDEINKTIQNVGCADSVFNRKMMDFAAVKEGRQNYTSAADMFSIMDRMYHGMLLGASTDSKMLDIMKGQADEEMMRRWLPDDMIIARKSGELDGLDHDLAIVFTEKGDYIYAFFTWGGKDCNETRDTLAESSKIVFDSFMA